MSLHTAIPAVPYAVYCSLQHFIAIILNAPEATIVPLMYSIATKSLLLQINQQTVPKEQLDTPEKQLEMSIQVSTFIFIYLAPSGQELYVKCNGFRTFSRSIFAIGTRETSEYSILEGSLLLINK